ncbi:MAG: XrtA system polysaccharide deacetylase [Pseudomonadota bacterium]
MNASDLKYQYADSETVEESLTFSCVEHEAPAAGVVNAMTCDVEDYYQVSAFENTIDRDSWARQESRLERNMDVLLRRFDEADTKVTFFILGWIAEQFPTVIRSLADAGHEIASHGYDHRRVREQTPDAFFEDIKKTKSILEDVTGQQVKGYRAPSFSIAEQAAWSHPLLERAGYVYSSSIYPVSHDHYGMPDAPRTPFTVNGGRLLEIPMSTIRIGAKNLPCSGGGFFRLLPVRYFKYAIKKLNGNDRQPLVFYFHPWEIDPDQPRVPGISLKTRFRHYVNLRYFEPRLVEILKAFKWGRMDDIYLGKT